MEFTPKETILSLLQRYAAASIAVDDSFFQDGNRYIKPFSKMGVLSEIPPKEPEPEPDVVNISCNVPDCQCFCRSVAEYEFHYNAQHRYTCAQCKKSLPNAHLLDLHLSETHDSFFAAQVQSTQQAMYACFLETCVHRSKNPEERRDHCIREHKFPHNFRFDNQMHQSKSNKMSKKVAMNAEQGTVSTKVLEEDKPAPPRCRKNFSFGQPQQRTFKPLKAPSQKCDILENNQMVVDLLESLPK